MHTRASLIATILLVTAACAGGQGAGDYGTGSPQQNAALQTTDYRTQANSLREMADRRQLEADLLAREVGRNGRPVSPVATCRMAWCNKPMHLSDLISRMSLVSNVRGKIHPLKFEKEDVCRRQ